MNIKSVKKSIKKSLSILVNAMMFDMKAIFCKHEKLVDFQHDFLRYNVVVNILCSCSELLLVIRLIDI